MSNIEALEKHGGVLGAEESMAKETNNELGTNNELEPKWLEPKWPL